MSINEKSGFFQTINIFKNCPVVAGKYKGVE